MRLETSATGFDDQYYTFRLHRTKKLKRFEIIYYRMVLQFIKGIIKRTLRWLLSLILLPFKLVLSFIGKVVAMLLSLVLLILIIFGLIYYVGEITSIQELVKVASDLIINNI